jgi:hypothetical protein
VALPQPVPQSIFNPTPESLTSKDRPAKFPFCICRHYTRIETFSHTKKHP